MFDPSPAPPTEPPAEPEIPRTRIPGHRPRSRTTIHGKASIFFGLPFFGVGVFLVLMSLDVIPTDESSFHGPRSVGVAGGALFALAGLAFLAHGITGVARQRRVRRERAAGAEHWLIDHPWDPAGIDADARGLASPILFIGVCGTFLWIVLTIRQEAGGGSFLFTAIAGFLIILVLVGLAHTGSVVARRVRYGRSHLEFRTFPFFLGEKVDAVFRAPRGLGAFESLSFRLRCVEETYVTHGHGENQQQVVVSHERHGDERSFDSPANLGSEAFESPVVLPLPAGDLETCLRERPPTYWELEVKTQGRGLGYQSTFLLPVYARNRTEELAQ